MPERRGGNPSEGDFEVTDEGDVIPSQTEPRPYSIHSKRVDVGHDAILEHPLEGSSNRNQVGGNRPDDGENPYWPNEEEKTAAARAKQIRDATPRVKQEDPWRSKLRGGNKTEDSDSSEE